MKYVLLFAFVITLISCNKNKTPLIGENEYVTLSYKQTSCIDVWGYGTTDSLTLVKVAGYLNNNSLYIASLSIKNDGVAEACLACPCKTGKSIIVSTLNSQSLIARYNALGFK